MSRKMIKISKVAVYCVIFVLLSLFGRGVQTVAMADLPVIELNTTNEAEEEQKQDIETDNVESQENSKDSNLFIYILIGIVSAIAIISIIINIVLMKKKKEMSGYQKKIDSIKNDFDITSNKDLHKESVEEKNVIEVKKCKYTEMSATAMLWKIIIQVIDRENDIVYEASFSNTDENKKITIGRGERSNVDIKIALPNVSDKHCEIIKNGNKYYLKDLASTNGTRYEGVKVNDTILINERGVLHLGKSQFELIIIGR